MTKHLKISAVALLVGGIFLLPSCYPKGAEYVDELDLVYTNYDNTADFSTHHTYAIPDSVVKISSETFQDNNGNGKPDFVQATYGTTMLNRIQQNLNSYGWTMVDKNANPDVFILVVSMVTENTFYYYDWGYWGWWYPGYNPGWGWYYPYYPPYPYVSSYLSGSIFIQMINNKPASTPNGENVPVIWSCIVNGLAEGSASSINARIQTNIDNAFKQSPYLKH